MSTTCGAVEEVDDRQRDVADFFGLSYANYFALDKRAVEVMPDTWRTAFEPLRHQLHRAFDYTPRPEAYICSPAEERYLDDLTERELAIVGCSMEENTDDAGRSRTRYYDEHACEVDGDQYRVLLPTGTYPPPQEDIYRFEVWPRTFMQSMPQWWQHAVVPLLDAYVGATEGITSTELRIEPAVFRTVRELSAASLTRFGFAVDTSADEPVIRDTTGDTVPLDQRVLVPIRTDLVPYYDCGRTRLEPASIVRLACGQRGVRGQDNRVFTCGYESDEQVEQNLHDLEHGDLEVSRRPSRFVPLRIAEVLPDSTHAEARGGEPQ